MPSFSRRQFLQTGAASLGIAAAASAAEPMATKLPPWAQTSDRKIRIGVVGGRFGLSFHWHEHPNCVVHAVSDLLPDRRKQLQGKYLCELAYDSLEELVKDPQIEAVALFTPAPDHARHTKLCMEHGKHVIAACPAVMSLDEAAELVAIKEHSGLYYMSAETSYYRWPTILARELLAENKLGDLVYCEAEYYHPGIGRGKNDLSFQNGQRTWRWGFPPMLYPTHSTAFYVGATKGRLTKVSCIGFGDPNEESLRDNAYNNNPFLNGMAMFETADGLAFRCNVAWDIYADGERAQWFGNKGAMYMENGAGMDFGLFIHGEDKKTLPDYYPLLPEAMRYDSGHGSSHPFLTHEFVMALVEDREPAIDLYESLAFAVPGVVAHESSLKGGERLTIPQFDRPGAKA